MGDNNLLVPGMGKLDSRIPDFTRKFANLHYQSSLTQEFGTIFIRPHTTEEDILNQYARLFPKECSQHISTVAEMCKALDNKTGMSQAKTIGALTKIPEILFMAMRYLDLDFWEDKKNVYRFIRKYPVFQVGDHSQKRR